MRSIIGIVGALIVAVLLLVPAVLAAEPLPNTGRVLISTEGDISVAAGQHADLVVVVNGTATIEGEVKTIVAVDGAAVLTGARTETVISIGSPVTLGDGTVVLGDVMVLDAVVERIGDAEVGGAVRDLQGELIGLGAVLAPALFLLWIGFGLATIAAGLLVAGLAARQVRAAEELISREPGTTVVAGLLAVVVIPVVALLLIVTVIGAPLGIGILIELWPLAAFLGYLVAGIWLGDWLLHRLQPAVARSRPFLPAVVGILLLQVLSLVPILALVAMIASLFGFGAVVLLAWRTVRSSGAPRPAVASAAPAPVAT
jgi:hypothetical protein